MDDFPPLELLGSFLESYFEHFNPMIPIIHHATFEPSADIWILLLAMMTVGDQHSRISTREQYITTFQALLQHAISEKVSPRPGNLARAESHSCQTEHRQNISQWQPQLRTVSLLASNMSTLQWFEERLDGYAVSARLVPDDAAPNAGKTWLNLPWHGSSYRE